MRHAASMPTRIAAAGSTTAAVSNTNDSWEVGVDARHTTTENPLLARVAARWGNEGARGKERGFLGGGKHGSSKQDRTVPSRPGVTSAEAAFEKRLRRKLKEEGKGSNDKSSKPHVIEASSRRQRATFTSVAALRLNDSSQPRPILTGNAPLSEGFTLKRRIASVPARLAAAGSATVAASGVNASWEVGVGTRRMSTGNPLLARAGARWSRVSNCVREAGPSAGNVEAEGPARGFSGGGEYGDSEQDQAAPSKPGIGRTGRPVATPEAAFEKRLRRNLKEEGKGSDDKISKANVIGASDLTKDTVSRDQRAATVTSHAAFEERIRRKLRQEGASRKDVISRGQSAATVTSEITLEERIRRKLRQEGSSHKDAISRSQIATVTAIAVLDERLKRKLQQGSNSSNSHHPKLNVEAPDAGMNSEKVVSSSTRKKLSASKLLEEKLRQKVEAEKLKQSPEEEQNSAHIMNVTDNVPEVRTEENKPIQNDDRRRRRTVRREGHSSKSKEHTVTKEDHFKTSDSEFQRRMIRRSLRKGLGRSSSKKMIAVSIEEECQTNLETSTRKLIDDSSTKHSCYVRSCSSENMCPSSWECPDCSYINEPVGLDPGTVCRVCQEPRVQRAPHERGLRRTTTPFALDDNDAVPMNKSFRPSMHRNDTSFDSWSDLSDVLAQAINKSLL